MLLRKGNDACHQFIKNYPDSHLVAESHFLLANSYKRLKRPREAVAETLNFVRRWRKRSIYYVKT